MIMQSPRDEMKRLRRQMLVHSYIYYVLGDSLISDHDWQRRADRLTALQLEYPTTRLKLYDEVFKDWDGTTGIHLPVDHWVRKIANRLLYYRDVKPKKKRAKVKKKTRH